MNPVPSIPLPRLLLVEDDPVSAAFLCEAARALPAEVHVAASIADARRAIGAMHFDLWLVDANLPDGRGETLLPARGDAARAPALAHTAAGEAAMRERLLSAGFLDVLCKPLAVSALHAALRRHLEPPSSCATLPHWDDAAALSALGGQQEHVQALRALFLKELPRQRHCIDAAAAAGDDASLRAELHRLTASCGFVGAARLLDAVRSLQESPLDPAALRQFDAAVDDLSASA